MAAFREQVERQRRPSGCREATGDVADVIGQATVLVDDQDRAARLGGRRQAAISVPLGPPT